MKDITKLPLWAQERINTLERERDIAIETMNKTLADQVKSPIYTDDMPCTGEGQGPSIKRRYFQARHLRIDHAGIEVDIFLAGENDSQRPYGVCISFCGQHRHLGHVGIVPTSFNEIALVSKENMR